MNNLATLPQITAPEKPVSWLIESDNGGDECYYIVADLGLKWNNHTICRLYDDVTPEDSVTLGAWLEPLDNAKANANLISAAPDLRAALLYYMSQFGQALEAHGIPYGPAQIAADAQARAAIAKADGLLNIPEGK